MDSNTEQFLKEAVSYGLPPSDVYSASEACGT